MTAVCVGLTKVGVTPSTYVDGVTPTQDHSSLRHSVCMRACMCMCVCMYGHYNASNSVNFLPTTSLQGCCVVHTAILKSFVPQPYISQGTVPKCSVPQGYVHKCSVPQGSVHQCCVPQGSVHQCSVPQGSIHQC